MTRKSGYQYNLDAAASEHAIQSGIVEWVRLLSVLDKRLRLLYAVPNAGKRSGIGGLRLRDEGLTRGVPDLCLAHPGKLGAALYLEVKTPKGKPSEDQVVWHQMLREAGYGCVIVTSIEEGIRVICEHLDRLDLLERSKV